MANDCVLREEQILNLVYDEDAKALRIVGSTGGGGSSLNCLNDVIDLTALVPLVLTLPSISTICSVEFENTNGKRIYINYTTSTNVLTVCSRQSLSNVQYKVIGE